MTTLIAPVAGIARPFVCVTAEGPVLVLAEHCHDATRAVPAEFGWIAATIDLNIAGMTTTDFADL